MDFLAIMNVLYCTYLRKSETWEIYMSLRLLRFQTIWTTVFLSWNFQQILDYNSSYFKLNIKSFFSQFSFSAYIQIKKQFIWIDRQVGRHIFQWFDCISFSTPLSLHDINKNYICSIFTRNKYAVKTWQRSLLCIRNS